MGALDVVSVVTVTPFNLVSVVAVTSFKGLKSEGRITKKKKSNTKLPKVESYFGKIELQGPSSFRLFGFSTF